MGWIGQLGFGFAISAAAAQGQSMWMAQSGPVGGPLTPPANKVPAEQRCIISGQATNALTGEPLKKVNLRLAAINQAPPGPVNRTMGGMSQQGYAVTSEADGTFRIEGIEPGTYNLSGTRTGFLNGYYGAKGQGQLGNSISLSPSQSLTGLTLALMPQAVVSGKVLDEDGEPSAGTMIQVMASMWQRGKKIYMPRQSAVTNDLGEFRIASLGPGKYFLSAQHRGVFMGQAETASPSNGKPDMRPILTYYPGTPNMESATVIEVKPGQDVSGLEIRMQIAQTYHVRGHVTGVALEEGRQHGMVSISPKSSGGFVMPQGQSQIKPDGSFDIAGVAPGSYNVTLMLMSGNIRSGGRQAVEIAGGDVNDVSLTTASPITIRGILKIEGSPAAGTATADLAAIQPHLFPADFGMFSPPGQTKVEKDGTFTIENVAAGIYNLNIQPPHGTYLKSVLNGQTETKGGDIDLTGGAGELQVILHYGVAEVTGTVQAPQTTNGTAAQIVLVPEPLNPNNFGNRVTGTDVNGAFTLKELPPGHYRALALAQFDSSQMQNPEILKQLAAKGTEFEVKENDRKQLTLSLLSDEEQRQLQANAENQ